MTANITTSANHGDNQQAIIQSKKNTSNTPLSLALVGVPNCGKTAIFNALTGSKAKVANYAGVTVDKRTAHILSDSHARLIDLPGTYSLHVTSLDEAVTRKAVLGQLENESRPDAMVVVVDATNIRMSLRMILELKTLGLPMIVALNLSDVARQRGFEIDTTKLSQLLGVTVVETIAISPTKGMFAMKQALPEFLAECRDNKEKIDANFDLQTVEKALDELDSQELYAQADNIIADVVLKPTGLPIWHERLDAIVMHPVWGMVLLAVILFLVFQSVYAWASPIMDLIDASFGALGEWVASLLGEGMLSDLLVNGVIAGVGGVLIFIPQIAILFLFILVLEDSGYLPRAAFLLDNLLSKIGLSGRAFLPLLSSFACAIPAVMSTRTITDPRERLVTIAVAPILTCSARLPVYALIIAAIIPQQTVFGIFNLQGITLFVLYVVGMASVALVAWLSKKFASRNQHMQSFPLLMELPTYRMPNVKHISTALWERVSAFLKRAGTVIFALSVILWVLVTFPSAPTNATEPAINYSFAGMLGAVIQPIFAPLGFTWQMCIAMIPGMAAREVVVAALGTVYAVSASSDEALEHGISSIVQADWGLPVAFAFLAWYVYAPMCLATLAVINRETKSRKQTAIITAYLFALAYIMAFIVYRVSLYFLG